MYNKQISIMIISLLDVSFEKGISTYKTWWWLTEMHKKPGSSCSNDG